MYQVLIVEDDPMVAMINEQYIRRNGKFEVAGICGDGELAAAFLEKTPVDLIVLDVYMPKTNGLELLKRIRERGLPVSVIMETRRKKICSILTAPSETRRSSAGSPQSPAEKECSPPRTLR